MTYLDATHPAARLLRHSIAAANTGIELARLAWQMGRAATLAAVWMVWPGIAEYVRKDVTK